MWLGTEWGGLAIRVFGDKAGLDCAGREPGLYILNHPGDIDFLTGLMVAYEFNMLTVRVYVFIFVYIMSLIVPNIDNALFGNFIKI